MFNTPYLDDRTIIDRSEEVAKTIDIVWQTGPSLAVELNVKKKIVAWKSY